MQGLQSIADEKTNKQQESTSPQLQPNLQKLQKENQYTLQKIENLEKRNNVLQKQVNDFALLFKEEKNEKQMIQKKLDDLNDKYNQKIEAHIFEKLGFARKYYTLYGFLLLFGLILLRLIHPTFLAYFQK